MKTGYSPVNGLQIYYEIHGPAGASPLVLLHGGGDTIETSFGRLLPALARNWQVIAFEQQGCGRTTDILERPFSFEQSVDDTVALLVSRRIPKIWNRFSINRETECAISKTSRIRLLVR